MPEIGLRQNLGKVFLGEIADQLARLPTQRDGEDPLAPLQLVGCFRLHVAEERMQRREPMVPRVDRCVPVVFEVIEESLHQRHIDVLEAESFQRDAAPVATEPKEQRERVAIGPDGVRAQVPLRREVMRQEAGEVHGKVLRVHECALRGMTSPNAAFARAVTSGNNLAVRWTYRAVPSTDRWPM